MPSPWQRLTPQAHALKISSFLASSIKENPCQGRPKDRGKKKIKTSAI